MFAPQSCVGDELKFHKKDLEKHSVPNEMLSAFPGSSSKFRMFRSWSLVHESEQVSHLFKAYQQCPKLRDLTGHEIFI